MATSAHPSMWTGHSMLQQRALQSRGRVEQNRGALGPCHLQRHSICRDTTRVGQHTRHPSPVLNARPADCMRQHMSDPSLEHLLCMPDGNVCLRIRCTATLRQKLRLQTGTAPVGCLQQRQVTPCPLVARCREHTRGTSTIPLPVTCLHTQCSHLIPRCQPLLATSPWPRCTGGTASCLKGAHHASAQAPHALSALQALIAQARRRQPHNQAACCRRPSGHTYTADVSATWLPF